MTLIGQIERTTNHMDEALNTATEIANVRATADSIWNQLSLKEKLHFMKRAGYEIELSEDLKKIYN